MTVSIDYLASVFNSTLRYMTPILLVALCAGVCSKVKVFKHGDGFRAQVTWVDNLKKEDGTLRTDEKNRVT